MSDDTLEHMRHERGVLNSYLNHSWLPAFTQTVIESRIKTIDRNIDWFESQPVSALRA